MMRRGSSGPVAMASSTQRGRLAGRVRLSLVFVLGSIALVPAGAVAFLPMQSPQTDGYNPLLGAPRWNHNELSLEQFSERGLGAGLEYSLSTEFCERLPPRFVGPDPTCDELRATLLGAFAVWQDGNPVLGFADTTGRILAQTPPGTGAEIDVFALTPDEFPGLGNASGRTVLDYGPRRPFSTNGSWAGGRTIYTADIVIAYSREACFYMEFTKPADGCVHFPSLLLHEVGHALGLNHPDEHPHVNVDRDNNPRNSVSFDCDDVARGLGLGRPFDHFAVMVSDGPTRWPRVTLAPDDVAGRNFLYPLCGGEPERAVEGENRPRPYRFAVQTPFVSATVPPADPPSTPGLGLAGFFLAVLVVTALWRHPPK